MTDVRITDLPSLTGASSTGNDVVPIVTVTSDITSKMTRTEFFKNIPAMTITGAITSGTWNATPITVPYGGTNITSYAIGDIIYASGATTLSKLADIATGNVLLSGGVGIAPSYGKVALTTHVTGVLPFANGGTNAVTAGGAFASMIGFTTTATAASVTALTNASTQYQLFTGTSTQLINLPVTSTLAVGWTFQIANNSTGNLTVRSSGLNTIAIVYPAMTLTVTCIGTTLTTAADWEAGYTDFGSVTGTGSAVLAVNPTITGGNYNGTVGFTTRSTGLFTTLSASTSVLSSGTGGVGYSTGAGGIVTQATSRTTGVTLAKLSGKITLFSTTTTAGTFASFTVSNSLVAATDAVIVNISSAATADRYSVTVTAVASGSFRVQIHNIAAVAVAEAPVLNFVVIKGVSA